MLIESGLTDKEELRIRVKEMAVFVLEDMYNKGFTVQQINSAIKLIRTIQ